MSTSTTSLTAPQSTVEALDQLLRHAKIWRAGDFASTTGTPTTFPVLDAILPNHGWPRHSLTEILTRTEGAGAMRLVLPALARISQEQWLVWVCPPHVPYAPALQAAGVALERLLIVEPEEPAAADLEYKLWVFEQALRFPDCGAAMVWMDDAPYTRLRRLQLACEQGQTWGVLFRPECYALQTSPAALRLSLNRCAGGTEIDVLKSQGGSRAHRCQLDL